MIKTYYTWNEISDNVEKLEKQLNPDDYDIVVGISRGGLIPAVKLSHFLSKPLCVLNWQTRDGTPPTDLPADMFLSIVGSRILLVDDICDSGETLHQIFQTGIEGHAASIKVAVIQYNEAEKLFVPDYFAEKINKVENPTWIVYPWEKADD